MTTVLLVGKNDGIFTRCFLKQLSSYIYMSLKGVRLKRLNQSDYFVYDTDDIFYDIELKYDIIIFKNSFFEDFNLTKAMSEKCVVFLSSDNEKAKNLLSLRYTKYISFGQFDDDTVSVSSISDDSMTICIQKPFIDMNKQVNIAEEFIVKGYFNNQSLFPAMAGGLLERIRKKEETKVI